jgi:hypothetical protein
MASTTLPIGPFTCEVVLRRIRAPQFVREERQGVTYLVARDYELAYETTLQFSSGTRLPVKARLVGELNQRIVIRNAQGQPVRISGYVQGLAEISDSDGLVIFRGRYYDSRVVQSLAGDEALTPVGQSVVDHCENGFGEGRYAGHAFSVGVQLTREGDSPLRGEGHGHID